MVYFQPFSVDYLQTRRAEDASEAECLPSSVRLDHENSTKEKSEGRFPKHLSMTVHGIVLAKI